VYVSFDQNGAGKRSIIRFRFAMPSWLIALILFLGRGGLNDRRFDCRTLVVVVNDIVRTRRFNSPDRLCQKKLTTVILASVFSRHFDAVCGPFDTPDHRIVVNVDTKSESFRNLQEAVREHAVTAFVVKIAVLVALDTQVAHGNSPIAPIDNVEIPSGKPLFERRELELTSQVHDSLQDRGIRKLKLDAFGRFEFDTGR
jgi:hypothetical protein